MFRCTIDWMGRIILPYQIRKFLSSGNGDDLIIKIENGKVILSKDIDIDENENEN